MKKLLTLLVIIAGFSSCTNDVNEKNMDTEALELASKSSSDNVTLLKAWSSNESSPVQQKYVRRFMVKVKNLDYQKEIYVHHQSSNGDWVDIPLSYELNINDEEEIWSGITITDYPAYGNQFVIKYVVGGQVYWDNNKGSNYTLPPSAGAYLHDAMPVLSDTYYTKLVGNYFVVNADVLRDYSAPAKLEVIYTTDNWKTTLKRELTYYRYFRVGYAEYIMSPNQYDVDKYETSVRFDQDIAEIEYALVLTINGKEYWDNNYDNNYKVINTY